MSEQVTVQSEALRKIILPKELEEVFAKVNVVLPESRKHLLDITFMSPDTEVLEVAYDVSGKGRVVEATVTRCKNGASVNYPEPYMRRRDPNAMLIADDGPTDKVRYKDRFGEDFDPVRKETFEWFKTRDDLLVLPLMSGDRETGYPTLLVAPINAGFFVTGLSDLQGFIPAAELPENFKPVAILYLAPPFRHTHFDGKQVVIHNRLPDMHELFCYNLYPGPSAKKGVYGILITRGEQEGWVTLHSSAVRLITPYDNEFVIMHEGASGGGKSEMTQALHREPDGRILLGENIVTAEKIHIELSDTCELHPIADDMAQASPKIQNNSGRIVVEDAEEGWFLRVDHLTEYGIEPNLERLTIYPPEPLIFLNIDGKVDATCLIWEHTMDTPDKPCPNPRVIMPRRFVPNIVNGPVELHVRSFGVRTPPCTRENPNYGIIGLMHILNPALAWLWRLAAPRGHSNPSIVGTGNLESEGVGSYWPFATGKMVAQANLLLEQILQNPKTDYVLIPNQHVGANKVGFIPEWIAREYMARRGSLKFRDGYLQPSRCPLLGYALPTLKVEGQLIPKGFLQVNRQLEVGEEGYDAGAEILKKFFKKELEKFNTSDLSKLGSKIIEVCMSDGSLEDYEYVIRGY